MEEFERGPSVVRWFIVGGLLGAGTALLLAPASGKRTRDRLAKGWREAKDSASAMTGELAGRARGIADAMGTAAREAERSARR